MPISKIIDDAELVIMLKEHKSVGYEYLYQHYSKPLYLLILTVVKEPEFAADVLQEVFVKIWRSISEYEHKGRFFFWLTTIARTTSLDAVKSKCTRNNKLNTQLFPDENRIPFSSFDRENDSIGIYKFIDHLTQDHKTLIMLSYYQGFTHQQISKILKMPMGTVKTKISSAIKRLRKLMY